MDIHVHTSVVRLRIHFNAIDMRTEGKREYEDMSSFEFPFSITLSLENSMQEVET